MESHLKVSTEIDALSNRNIPYSAGFFRFNERVSWVL